jgi:hypothetical protein
MFRNFRVLILLALAALVLIVTPAYSTVITQYNDLGSFNAATSGDVTADFEALTPGYYDTATGVSAYPNVDFIGYNSIPAPYLQVIATAGSPYYDFGTGNVLVEDMTRPNSGSPLPYIHVVFTTPVTAFGANLFTNNDKGMSFGVTVLGTQYTVATSAIAPPTFWGITSDTPISSADFTVEGTSPSGGTWAFLDNFTYGTAQAQAPPPPDVPEAATFLLIGSGLLGLAILGKKMRPAQLV